MHRRVPREQLLQQSSGSRRLGHQRGLGDLELEQFRGDAVACQQFGDLVSHALGIKISIDDFGAGYTSLGQLTTLPLSELKIDRSFVDAMAADRSSTLIVQSVVDLGHNLGLTIVAEGVETETTLAALTEMGCDVAQGYVVSRPLTAAAIDAWRAERGIASGVS